VGVNNMKYNITKILACFVGFLFFSINNIYSQTTYSIETQNRSWNSNNEISTVFFKTSGTDLTITPSLKMIRFTDGTNKYGWSSDNSTNDIPSNWTYEILNAVGDVPNNTTVSNDKKSITFTADPDADLVIYLKVIDSSSGETIPNLGRVQLTLYIRGNFTVSTSQWNACEQAYIISVNEITVNGTKPCRPYRLILYNDPSDGPVDTSTVVYDSNNDSDHDANDNSFKLKNLAVGNYAAIITNSCGERVGGSNGYYNISITEAYSFGASVVFSGFPCISDNFGTAVIKVEGAAIPITWTLKNNTTNQVTVSSSDNSSFTTQNYDPNFDTQNFTITIPNLAEANYTFSFTDGNGCSEEEIIEVKKPEEIENEFIVSDSVTALDCYGDSDGKLTFIASGGWTEPWNGNTINPNGWGNPYIFKLTKGDSEYSSGEVVNSIGSNGTQNGYKTSFTGLSAGTYTLTVTENVATNPYDSSVIYKCSKIFNETFTITEPAELVASGTITNIDCNGNDNGAIDLSVAGGTANYTYAWTKTGDNSFSATSQNLTNLSPGTYNVTVTDANGCTDTASFPITEPTELTIADAGLSTEIACFGDNGQIKVNITQGSVANYTYALYQGNSVVQTITNSNLDHTFSAPAGTYKVRVTDANGCFKETSNITLTQPDNGLTISDETVNNIDCKDADNGSISITTTGGTANYTFQWIKIGDGNYSATSKDISNLSPGVYAVTITDANGCTLSKSFSVTEPDALTSSASVTNIDCNGNDNGSIDLSVAGGTADYTYAWTKTGDNSYSATTQDLSDLSPGTYNVTITDANDCTATNSFTITENAELSLTSSVPKTNGFEVSCFGGDDGSIAITMTGGTGTYTYNWLTNNGSGLVQGQEDQSGLSKGDYSLTVTDSNGCSVVSNFTLNSPDQMTITSTKSNFNEFNVSCNGDNNGSIDITVNGGYLDSNTTYTYSWTTNNGSGLNPNNEDQTGLTAGNYTVVATDTNGCSITQNIEITEPDSLVISEIISDYNGFEISEAGENDGSIDITVSGGTSNYTYEWTTQNGSGLSINSEDQSGLTAGVYTVLITDSNNCQISKTYSLTQPNELLIAIDHDANGNSVLCYGDTTASIKVDITQESVSPYVYSINGTTYLNQAYSETFSDISSKTYTFINLPAGNYSFTVTDANGVSKSTTSKEIFGPNNPLTLTSDISSYGNFNISCPGANDATINLTVTGGGGVSNQASYFYTWTTSDGSGLNLTEEDQSGLGPGTYTVVVKDINDCSITETFTITEAPPLTYNLDSTKNITCFGDNDGEINITVGGGTGNYTYDWSTQNGSGIIQGQEDQSGLGPGIYKLILRDGCNTFEFIHTISTPEVLEISLDEKVNILCHDNSTGKINISVNGGTAPFDYVWKDNFGNVYDRNVGNVFEDGDLSNIPAGIYELIVIDSNDCTATFTTELTQPEDLVIDIQKTDLNCYNANDGTITVTPSGGVAPYSYTWSDFGNGNVRNGLSAGSYTVTITDSNGCEEVREIEIDNAELFDVNPIVTPITCYGANDGSIEMNFEGGVAPISFTWSDDSTAGQNRYNLSPGIYSVLIKDASGCEIQRDLTIIEPQEISITGVLTDATDCDNPASGSIDLQVSGGNPPFTFDWSNGDTSEDISGLIANNYLVKVTDSKGCISEKEFTINRQDDLEINLETNFYAICETKEVYQKNIVSVSGGVAPYKIEWSNGLVSGNDNEIMDTKIEGSYQVTVTDFLGCTESIVFQVETPVIGSPDFEYNSFYLTNFNALSVNDPITFTNLSSENYFQVFWDFGDGNTSSDINAIHTYTKRGVYEVSLTVEFILGCSYTETKTIYVGDQYEIVIPNAFTPNNDGYNDTFRPVYYGFTYIILQVFDSWGNLIYTEESNSNELTGWDGKIKGRDAENGNYFYQVSGVSFTQDLYTKNGSFTLLK